MREDTSRGLWVRRYLEGESAKRLTHEKEDTGNHDDVDDCQNADFIHSFICPTHRPYHLGYCSECMK